MFSERLFEDILVKYPELIESNLKYIGRQVKHYGKRIDILFEDKFQEKLIIELKKDNLDRNALSQVLEYEGYILSEKDPSARVMLIANRIPLNLKKAMEHHGIEYKEITIKQLLDYLENKDSDLFNSMTSVVIDDSSHNIIQYENQTMAGKIDEILTIGGTWSDLIDKIEFESKKVNGKIKYSKGVINAHIKYRTITQKNPDYLKHSVINSYGVFPKGFQQNFANSKQDYNLRKARTVTGIEFEYEGTISSELTIYQNNSINKIPKEIIEKIKSEINQRSPVLMGACRDRPAKNSIGESLKREHHSPQNLSYVIPLLIEEGFCIASKKKPIIITKINSTTT